MDDYAAYQAAKKLLPKLIIVLCWSHARRAYEDALEAFPVCQQAIDIITRLFAIERELPDWQVITDPKLRQDALAKITAVRRERPVRRGLEHALERGVKANIERLSGACADMLVHRNALWTFVTHEGVHPTNNHAYAVHGISVTMPRARSCRIGVQDVAKKRLTSQFDAVGLFADAA